MKNRVSILFAVALSFAPILSCLQAAQTIDKPQATRELASPDGNISLTFSLTGRTPSCAVTFKKRPVLLPSALCFDLKTAALKSDFTLADAQTSSKNETWTQPWGEQREVRNHYNELTVTLQQTGIPGRKLRLIFRAF